MSQPADIAARTQRFNEAVRSFTSRSMARHAKVMPMKDGIIELRQKGASLGLIRELLATVGVTVGTESIALPRRRKRRATAAPIIETTLAPACGCSGDAHAFANGFDAISVATAAGHLQTQSGPQMLTSRRSVHARADHASADPRNR